MHNSHQYVTLYITHQGDRIHAWIGESVFQFFFQNLIEGQIYDITNFAVKFYENNEVNKCFEETKFLVFSNLTRISRVDETNNLIPKHVWKFTELSSIQHLNHELHHLIGKFCS